MKVSASSLLLALAALSSTQAFVLHSQLKTVKGEPRVDTRRPMVEPTNGGTNGSKLVPEAYQTVPFVTHQDGAVGGQPCAPTPRDDQWRIGYEPVAFVTHASDGAVGGQPAGPKTPWLEARQQRQPRYFKVPKAKAVNKAAPVMTTGGLDGSSKIVDRAPPRV